MKKKYKQTYKSKRKDYRKGGRVKAQRGGLGQKYTTGTSELMERMKNRPVQSVKKPTSNEKPIQPVRQPIAQEPKKPVQPGNLTTGGLGQNRVLPTGPAKTPVNTGRPIQRGGVGVGRRMTGREELGLANESVSGNQIIEGGLIGRQPGETAEQYRARTAGQFTPNPNQKTYRSRDEAMAEKAGLTLEEYKAQQEQNFNNLQTNDVPKSSQAFQRSPTIGKGSDQMFIDREGDVRPQAAQAQTTQAAQAQGPGGLWWRDAGYDSPREAIDDGWTYDSNSRTWSPGGGGTTGGTTTGGTTTGGTTTTTPTEPTAEELAAQEKARQQGVARQSAEAAARGEVPEAAQIPQAEQVGYQRDAQGQLILDDQGNPIPLREQQVTTMDPVTRARTDIQARGQAPEAVATSQAAQADTTIGQDIEAGRMEDVATVADKDVDVQAAREREARRIEDVAPGEITAGVKFATVDELQAEAAQAKTIDDVLTGTYLVDEVEGEDVTVAATPDAERSERETILGEPAPPGVAAAINDTVGYTAAKQRPVKGKAAQGAAADMIAQTADLPPDIAAAVVQDPATVEAQIDTQPVEVQAAVAALPQEALVSSQMETLLGGMEDGEIPMWARPAVDAVNAGLARRGMSVSTVGRDSLFNAIIQSALPMAQSNAQALQQRAAQNLSNEQQANLQQATQQQQLRLQNLANRQTAESQTAQMSQQMKVMQSQFDQQAVMTTAEQQQQTRLANLQNQQQAAVIRSQNEQQMAMQNLGNEQQLNMAELQIDAARAGADQSAENQEKILEMQIAADFLAKNAGFKQQMELANLTNDQQMRLANLSSRNLAESERMSNDEKIELANLNKTMQTNQLQAQLAQQMGIAQLNVDQQSAIQNATTKANMDMAKFSAAQQVELANSKFMQTVAITNMNAEQQAIMQNATAMASMDLANLSTRERLAVQNAQNFLAMDMANMNNEQQANMMKAQQEQQRLLSDQAATNAAKQFNAASENQTEQFMASLAAQIEQSNVAQMNAMAQFNDSQTNAAAARDANRAADVEKFNTQLAAQIDQFNANQDFARNQWNAQNQAVVEQSNTQWRRNMNTANTAMQNQINAQNAQNAFAMSQTAQSFLWQELRDQADYDFRNSENEKNRIAQLVNTALASDPSKYGGSISSIEALIGAITGDLFGG